MGTFLPTLSYLYTEINPYNPIKDMATDLSRSSSNLIISSNGSPYKTYGVDDLVSSEVVNGRLKLQFADGQFYDLDASDLSIQGAPFTGTAAELRDKLSTQVFNTYSTRQVLASNVPLSHTGNTTETTVYTGTIPANSIGVNGSLHFIGLISMTNNANIKTFRIKVGGQTIYSGAHSSISSMNTYTILRNRNALTSQVSGSSASAANGGFNNGTGSTISTYTLNTAADLVVTVAIQLASAADTAAVESFSVIAVN